MTSTSSTVAPRGILRAALNFGNSVLAGRDAAGEPAGISTDLAKELARRLNVPIRFVDYNEAGDVFADVDSDVWDVCFLADEPARAKKLHFSDAYVHIEGIYMVPPASSVRGNEDVDRKGVRIGVTSGSAYDLYLSRTLANATLERGPTFTAVLDMLRAGKIDVIAGVKPQVEGAARQIDGARLLPQPFMVIRQAMAVPRARSAAAIELDAFMKEVKRSGIVAELFKRNRVEGGTLAP